MGDSSDSHLEEVERTALGEIVGHSRAHYGWEVPSFFLTEKELKVIGDLYSYEENFSGVICSDHLFVKHHLIKRSWSNAFPKIKLAGLAAKNILPVMKEKTIDHDQKRSLAGLSLKAREKSQASASADPRKQ
ncbi:Uncharacterized protein Fot_37650 [Forsythia ovata]|uniref:Uncharacterized protein n=1 Tax=Forsythia ovata TaxID=205694 RepID=A0ABD1RZJ9_9LAMI